MYSVLRNKSQGETIQLEIVHRPSYSLAVARLTPNERIRAEAGAIVSMSGGVDIETKAEGGILKSNMSVTPRTVGGFKS